MRKAGIESKARETLTRPDRKHIGLREAML
jgi:hypothetical protein